MKILSKIIFALITLSFLTSASFAGGHEQNSNVESFSPVSQEEKEMHVMKWYKLLQKEVAKANVNFKIQVLSRTISI